MAASESANVRQAALQLLAWRHDFIRRAGHCVSCRNDRPVTASRRSVWVSRLGYPWLPIG